jgi:2-polyprenyl-3-methyl-5-hydroxy-6-metoxy-1,4-benzoquinol methylase
MSEPQYSDYGDYPPQTLGLRAGVWWHTDPRSLLFSMARYKFVAHMLAGKKNVLEVGCGDAFCTRIVQQEVGHVTAIDFDRTFINDAAKRNKKKWHIELYVHNILDGPLLISAPGGDMYDAAYALDVIEHIDPKDEHTFMDNIVASLAPHGVLILGTPSKESQIYASEGSKAGHVNVHTQTELKALMHRYFHNVFSLGMNDETLHTGFGPMCHYLFAIGTDKRDVQI